ncbi:Serine protease 46 [Operophtera brumata]|uniref:Serine protease 46 n=1 Tax=Operophtera brumata TaxID=104452 RepID=A0A0L7LJD0_OPEBR|nr:Serine protease 46 [Operophtera brumata]
MFGKVLFFLLPVVLRATRLCEGDECDARYARIAAGDRSEPNTRPFQIGVASFVSAGGCNDELPSVFTRTQMYLSWISDVTGIILD